MSRSAVFKILWLVIVLVGVFACVLAVRFCPYPLLSGMTLAVFLLIPGRVQGVAWRQFFTGRRAQAEGRWADAIAQYKAFLGRLRQRPGLKKLIWLSWAVYTRDIEAMTENNLGACRIELAEFASAESHLDRALALDPSYSIPHYNLAMVKKVLGDDLASKEHAERARKLGYSASATDLVVRRAGELLARVEGRRIPT